MRVRLIILAIATAFAATGCGEPPGSVFVNSEKLDELVREARRPVRDAIEENFGTPQDLVAWEKLPVDYGRVQGEVVKAVPGSNGVYELEVELVLPEYSDGNQPEFEAQGLSMKWTSGAYTDGSQVAGAESSDIVSPTTQHYDAASKTLTLAQKMDPAPQPGDTFEIVGHQLQSGRKLYMRHCVHCHGVSGDGNGPTAKYLNPLPRDYRPGIFKFSSTLRPEKPTSSDLKRVIKLGIPGTYMPSFMLLKDYELDAIVQYVRWLSMRGELESKLITEFAFDYSREAVDSRVDQGEDEDAIMASLESFIQNDFPGLLDDVASSLAGDWERAEDETSLVAPTSPRVPDSPESRKRGRALFVDVKINCAKCHGPTGIGNGSQTEEFQKIPGSEEFYPLVGLYDDWGHPVKPRNLQRGIYRGGRRPIDLYRRVSAGVKGTPMAGFATALNDEQMWDIVNYVLSIPFEDQSDYSSQESTQPALASSTTEPAGD